MNEILEKFHQKPFFKNLMKNLRISSLCFVVLLQASCLLLNYDQEQMNRQIEKSYGSWQYEIQKVSNFDLKKVEDSAIIEKYGWIESNGNIFQNEKKIGVLKKAGRDFFDLGVYKLIQGRWPQNENEIALSYSLALQIMENPEAGKKITLSLEENKKDFLISGLIQTPKNLPAALQIGEVQEEEPDIYFRFYPGFIKGIQEMDLEGNLKENPGLKQKQFYKKDYFYTEILFILGGLVLIYWISALYKESLWFQNNKKNMQALYFLGLSFSSMKKTYDCYLKRSFWPAYFMAAASCFFNVRDGVFISFLLLLFQGSLYVNSRFALKKALCPSKKKKFTPLEVKLSHYYYSFRFFAMNKKQNVLIILLLSSLMTFSSVLLAQDFSFYTQRKNIENIPSFTLSKNPDNSFLDEKEIEEIQDLKGVKRVDTYYLDPVQVTWENFDQSLPAKLPFFQNSLVTQDSEIALSTSLYVFENLDPMIETALSNKNFSKEKFEKGEQILMYIPKTANEFYFQFSEDQKDLDFKEGSFLKESERVDLTGEDIKNHHPECIFIYDLSSIPELENNIEWPYTLIASKGLLKENISFDTAEIFLDLNEDISVSQEKIWALARKYNTGFTDSAVESYSSYHRINQGIRIVSILLVVVLAALFVSCVYVFRLIKKEVKEQVYKMKLLNLDAAMQTRRLERKLLFPAAISLILSGLILCGLCFVYQRISWQTNLGRIYLISYSIIFALVAGLYFIFIRNLAQSIKKENEERT